MPGFSQDFLTTFMAKSCTVYITFIELNTNNYTYTGFLIALIIHSLPPQNEINGLHYNVTTEKKQYMITPQYKASILYA